jgi:hypothetical protein
MAMAQNVAPGASMSVGETASAQKESLMLRDKRHWQSFLELAAMPNAEVTLEDLKRAFPGEVITSTLPGVYEIPHVLRYSVSVSPRLQHLYPGRKQINISLDFQNAESTTCKSKEQLVSDLQKAGWKIYSDLPERVEGGVDGMQLNLPSEADMQKGDQGVLKLVYSNGCPSHVFLQVDKIRFDEIPALRAEKENGQ